MTYCVGHSFLTSHTIKPSTFTWPVSHRGTSLQNCITEGKRERKRIHLPALSLVCHYLKFALQGVNQIRSHTSSHSFPSYITFLQHLRKSDPCFMLPWDFWKCCKELEVPTVRLVGLRIHTSWSSMASVSLKRSWGG